MITVDQATRRALKLVMGEILDEYVEATRAHAAGEIGADIYEPIKRGFNNTLERRRGQIVDAAIELQRGALPPPPCMAAVKGVRCTKPSTTSIAGRHFCDEHAPLVPRLEIPAGRAA